MTRSFSNFFFTKAGAAATKAALLFSSTPRPKPFLLFHSPTAMEFDPPEDLTPLLEAASDFAPYPGMENDAAVMEFLDRFPLHSLIGVLQSKSDEPGVVNTVVCCLDKIFSTRYGASLLPQYAAFIRAGLEANSQKIRCLACRSVSYLLKNSTDLVANLQIVAEYNVYPLLLSCLVDGDELTSAASLEAIESIAHFPEGIGIIFLSGGEEPLLIKNKYAQSSSLGRVRILALVAKLFSLSSSVAAVVNNSNLLNLFEIEINNGHDTLTTLSALEISCEMVECPHSSMFLSRTTLVQLLTNMISNSSADSILRSRAALLSGRILSSSDAYPATDVSSVMALLDAIDGRLKLLTNSQDKDECESAVEALGLIGATSRGATILLTSSLPVARHVVESAFERQGGGKQLAGLHALASICGVDRPEDSMILDDKAEENLRRLIYAKAADTPKLKPSGLVLSVLRQERKVRLAGYRLVSALVVRRWCLMEICSEQEIITIVTDADTETEKYGADARHQCCTSIRKALFSSNLLQDASYAGIAGKLQEAVRRGPYLPAQRVEAQPVVMTADRF